MAGKRRTIINGVAVSLTTPETSPAGGCGHVALKLAAVRAMRVVASQAIGVTAAAAGVAADAVDDGVQDGELHAGELHTGERALGSLGRGRSLAQASEGQNPGEGDA